MPRTGGLSPRLQNAKADAYISGLTEGLRLAAGPDHTLHPGLAAQFERLGDDSRLACVEEWLSPGVDLGPGAYVDWHVPEATYARKLRESQRHRGLSVFRG